MAHERIEPFCRNKRLKLLLDTCVWGGARLVLTQGGHDVVWNGDWQQDPSDEEILAYAFREGRVVIALHGKEFESGAIITAEPGRLRLRLPENKLRL